MIKKFESVNQIRNYIKECKNSGKTIGFVPTMGYLHEGHVSLMKKARKENDIVVVSIYINPTQFGANEDLEKYPRNHERDYDICKNAGVDAIFFPSNDTMYGENYYTYINVECLENNLCGKSRKGHFKGVATVVAKLFNIVSPTRAYFGKKDAQQLIIIKKMTEDLNFDVEIIGCDIIREEDGLAMSSRNVYLSKEERIAALKISKALKLVKDKIENGEKDSKIIYSYIFEALSKEELINIDYIEIVNVKNLERVSTIETNVLIAVAAFLGNTRLIDNYRYIDA